MKVIDWRLRPPFGTYFNCKFYRNGCGATMEDVIKEMDEAGVEIGIAPFRKGMDNADCLKFAEQYPNRFRTLIHIDPWDGMPALKDIDKYVLNGPAAGVVIEPGMFFIQKSIPADDKRCYPIYEKCEKENLLLTIGHGGMGTLDPALYNPSYIAHVCDDFPNLKIVVAHGGWPWTAAICQVAYMHKNLYICPDAYLSRIQPGHMDYVAAASGWLSDRIIFGSAYVYGMDLKGAVQEYKELLPENIIEKVLYQNAAKLLGL